MRGKSILHMFCLQIIENHLSSHYRKICSGLNLTHLVVIEDPDRIFAKVLKNIHRKFGAVTLTAVELFAEHTNFDLYIYVYMYNVQF